MLRLFYILFHGCDHKWEDTGESRYKGDFGAEGPIVYVRCRKCGRHSYFKDAVMKERP